MTVAAPGSCRVRPATRADLDAVLEIEAASFSTPWSRRTFEALLERPTVHFRVLEVAPAERAGAGDGAGVIRGHAILWWSGPEAEVANVAVHPELRGQGAGGLLLDALLAEAGLRGVETVFLEVRESNAAARALYHRRGFVQVGRRTRYYRAPVEDALVLARDLSAGETRDRPAPATPPPPPTRPRES